MDNKTYEKILARPQDYAWFDAGCARPAKAAVLEFRGLGDGGMKSMWGCPTWSTATSGGSRKL